MIILLPLGQERMVNAPGSPETTERQYEIQSTFSKMDTFGTGTKCPY